MSELKHYGALGMKWSVRKEDTKDSRKDARTRRKMQERVDSLRANKLTNKRVEVMQNPKFVSDGAEFVKNFFKKSDGG